MEPRRTASLAVTTAFVNLLAACATNPPPVPVAGSPFHLHAGADSAHGDVVMVPRGAREPIRPAPLAPGAAAPPVLDLPRLLTMLPTGQVRRGRWSVTRR